MFLLFAQDCRKFLNLVNGMQGDGRRYFQSHEIPFYFMPFLDLSIQFLYLFIFAFFRAFINSSCLLSIELIITLGFYKGSSVISQSVIGLSLSVLSFPYRVFSYPCLEVFLDKHEVSAPWEPLVVNMKGLQCLETLHFGS